MTGRNPNKKYFTQRDVTDALPAFMERLHSGQLKPSAAPSPAYVEGTDLVMEFDSADEATDFYVALTLYMTIQQHKAELDEQPYGQSSLLN